MTLLTVLIPIALFLGLLGLGAFIWSLNSGQYEDLDGAAARISAARPAPSAAPSGRRLAPMLQEEKKPSR